MNWYQMDEEQILEELKTSRCGLNEHEVKIRQEQYGSNTLKEGKVKSPLMIFLSQFKDLLVIILIVAAFVSFISGEKESTIVILAVITMNAVLGTIQEIKAQKSLDSLKQLSLPKARVLRDNQKVEIDSRGITVGDILLVEAGDVVGADGRIIDSFSLQINESSLTGEALSVDKMSASINEECALGDQKNMAFSSGLVTYGRGSILVTEIGMNTQIGKIARMLDETKERKSPLQRNLDDFSKKLSVMILVICLAVFGLSIMQGTQLLDALMFAVALAVAAIPEALASIVTIVLAIGTQRMAKEHAIMKQISAVESLGSVSVICSDKTGTLTQNKMTVMQVYFDESLHEPLELDENRPLDRMIMLGFVLCNDAQISGGQKLGDPTEIAFLDLLAKYKIGELSTRDKYPRIAENPFDSERKLMSTLHRIDEKNMILCKGAPDELIMRCTSIQREDGIHPITEADKESILNQNHAFAKAGFRVLGFACRLFDKDDLELKDEQEFTFLGLASLMDPPREESTQAVADCFRAGIKPIMITGDHKITAVSIARQIGIYHDGDLCFSGEEITKMSDAELSEKLPQISVYARVAPEHKIRIVDAWQSRGNIVAMTGDGVNDAPALKQADIGIAMGITGTQVSKDAAKMILTDDNFATIIKAVATGRTIFTNIRNAILYLLSGNLSGIICVLAASLLMLKVPFFPVHLLFINLITDSLPAIAIGMEKVKHDILSDAPRDMKEGILNGPMMRQIGFEGIVIAAATMTAYFIGLKTSYPAGATMAFATLCLARLLHGFNCRSRESLKRIGFFSNPYSILAFLVGFAFLNIILLVPSLHSWFSVTTISMEQLFMIYGLALLPTILIQIVKMLQDPKG
ncbi:HAD-IC family P-type ATPase [Clostridiaceae bacterium DONG20-135]|uniref:HAD-IC family P-type ATPase n=1 Tax=Copranaerobaculum intestinale TaxID=2692629 RepID=A0A6N8U4J0_9FIRM|nr:cation-translocating P-type ATPase [Copranaerobaculum intestinale]MXQ73106.1 HAD-IC family P-type ATPase [Copranaerobaculum intestinale]